MPKTILDAQPEAVVFLDRNQAASGHILIVPRPHVAQWHEFPVETTTVLARLAHKWAAVLVRVLGIEGYNLLMNNGVAAGQDVFHAHLHVTPRSQGDGYYAFSGVSLWRRSDRDPLCGGIEIHPRSAEVRSAV